MSLFYFSFTDPRRRKGRQFLGACYVEAPSLCEAITFSHVEGINPGGEIMILELPDGIQMAPEDMRRLLTKDEAENIEPVSTGSGPSL